MSEISILTEQLAMVVRDRVDIKRTLVETLPHCEAGNKIETPPEVRRHVGMRGHGRKSRCAFQQTSSTI